MAKKKKKTPQVRATQHIHRHGPAGAIYGLGLIGALIYYISTATSISMGILGILKAIVWPAFLVFELMKFLGM